jgi:hypothetical protein
MVGHAASHLLFPSPLWGGAGVGVVRWLASVDNHLQPSASRVTSRPPSLTLPHKGGGEEQA